jgi:hypothetical protein
LFSELLAFIGLEAADHVPADGAREELGLLEEFLDVVFAEVGVERLGLGGGLVEGEDVAGGFEFGYCY